MKSVSRSTVVIIRLFTNQRDQFVGVRSTLKGPDAISSHEERGASILIVRWILIQRSRCVDGSTDFKQSQPL